MTKRLTILFLSTMALVALAVGLGGAMAAPSAGATERVSLATDGTQGNKGSEDAALSGDGRYVAFESEASNLVANDTNGEEDIFVRNRQTGQTSRITVGPGGAQANGDSDDPDFSADGASWRMTRWPATSWPATRTACGMCSSMRWLRV